MPRLLLTSTVIQRAQQRADMVNDDSIANAEWLSYASEVYGDMGSEVSLLLSRYFETSATIPADGSVSYDEPAAHHSTVRVVEVMDDGTERPLRELETFEEAAYRGRTGIAEGWIHLGDQLFLCPAPTSGTFKWYYVAQPTSLASNADADPIDVVCPAGEAFLLWGMAALAMQKGGKAGAPFAFQKQEQARAQLQVWCANHNLTDVRTRGPVDYADDEGRPSWWVR